MSPFDPGLLTGDGLRQCREPSPGAFGIPAGSRGSRVALVAKKTNRVAPVCAWEAEKFLVAGLKFLERGTGCCVMNSWEHGC